MAGDWNCKCTVNALCPVRATSWRPYIVIKWKHNKAEKDNWSHRLKQKTSSLKAQNLLFFSKIRYTCVSSWMPSPLAPKSSTLSTVLADVEMVPTPSKLFKLKTLPSSSIKSLNSPTTMVLE